jgi:hypothetical protein
MVCHKCDNPPCVRPDHLFLGDDLVNVRDMIAKGRVRISSKLTPEQVVEIRARAKNGESQRSLSQAFGVTQPNIGYIVRGETWK